MRGEKREREREREREGGMGEGEREGGMKEGEREVLQRGISIENFDNDTIELYM